MIVGIIGDTQLPFTHPGYLDFCQDQFDAFNVKQVVHIGDVVDLHALSFYEHSPNGKSAQDETEQAKREVAKWKKAFPKVKTCIGNHDARHYRTARKAGIPDQYIKTYAEIWDTPRWDWQMEHVIDGVLYEHGTGISGKDAAFNRAIAQRCSVVMGHTHSFAGVKYHANPTSRIFGLNVGCGLDIRSYAFEYAKFTTNRPVLGCGVVVDGQVGLFVPMACSRGEKYHRSNFK
jgi:predicted phosphodiesterase